MHTTDTPPSEPRVPVTVELQPSDPPPPPSTSNATTPPSLPHHHRSLSEATSAVGEWTGNIFCAGWCTQWTPTQDIKDHYPPRHADFRDHLPDDMSTVYNLYKHVVKKGQWTFGLLEMWFPKEKSVKHSVHIPCWDSFKLNPCLWRGVCLGRTLKQCFWTGMRQSRWTRAVYAAGLGSEYIYPVYNVGTHGYKSSLKALCWLYCCMGCLFSCGIGQIFSLCGNVGCNFAACYSCHARERMRRKWNLPPMFGLPPGIDDCLVHFFCFYCSSHQEIRELAVRGIDGPGMHIFDVAPEAYAKLPGGPEAIAARKALVAAMVEKGPRILRVRDKQKQQQGEQASGAAATTTGEGDNNNNVTSIENMNAAITAAVAETMRLPRSASTKTTSTENTDDFGFINYGHHHSRSDSSVILPPIEQEMSRAGGVGGISRVYGPSDKLVPTLSRASSF